MKCPKCGSEVWLEQISHYPLMIADWCTNKKCENYKEETK